MNEHLPWSEQIRTIVQNFTARPAVVCPGETMLLLAKVDDADHAYAMKARAVDCPACGAPVGANCAPSTGSVWNHPQRASRQHMRDQSNDG